MIIADDYGQQTTRDFLYSQSSQHLLEGYYQTFNATTINTSTLAPLAPGAVKSSAFWSGFLSSLSLVFLSEFGDRTFFIAAILSTNHNGFAIFVATLLALMVNSLMACVFGALASKVPIIYIHYVSILLFFLFGLKTIYEAYYMSPENEHYRTARTTYISTNSNDGPTETQQQQQQKHDRSPEIANGSEEVAANNNLPIQEEGLVMTGTPIAPIPMRLTERIRVLCSSQLARVFTSTFLIILVAELGDRSQLSVLVLAARENVFGVALGTFIGQFICTSIAVLGGRLVGEKVSVRLVTFIAGVMFLLFALGTLISGVPNQEASPG